MSAHVPADVQAEWANIVDQLPGSGWAAQLENIATNGESWVATLTRRERRHVALGAPTLAGPSAQASVAPRMGVWPDRKPLVQQGNSAMPVGRNSETAPETELCDGDPQGVHAAPSPGIEFGDLPTMRAMSTGVSQPVVGFDTEFVLLTEDKIRRIIAAYQFTGIDPEDEDAWIDVVLVPLQEDHRLLIEDALAIVVREMGLWKQAGLSHPQGHARREFWRTGSRFKRNIDRLYKLGAVRFVLAGHFQNADLTTFRMPKDVHRDILKKVTSAGGGLVGLHPIRVHKSFGRSDGSRVLPMTITVRDTMCQTAEGSKSLAALGASCGIPKLDVGAAIEDMVAFRRSNLREFLEYGTNDARIVVGYLARLYGPNMVPPTTISGGGARALRAGIMDHLGVSSVAEFDLKFRGLVTIEDDEVDDSDGLAYYTERQLKPVDGMANLALTACKKAFHGGLNACLSPGVHWYDTFDHDSQNAYPTGQAGVPDVDFIQGCIEESIEHRDLTLDDFPLGAQTPLVAFVSWEFPTSVTQPSVPVMEGQSIVYPRTSKGVGAGRGEGLDDDHGAFEGVWVMGPELYVALKLGARVTCQIGYRLKVLEIDGSSSLSMRSAVRQMVNDRTQAKTVWGKGSLEDATLKVATNSGYGKLAQDVSERRGWNSYSEEMEDVGGSIVTCAYHAAMITSLVRALLSAMLNEVVVLSVTTDGFISPEEFIEEFECFGLAEVFRESRMALVGDPTVWEIKHRQKDLVNLTTRGNVSLEPGGVLAKAGLKTPKHIDRGSVEERGWFRNVAISREGKISNPHTTFPSFKELSRREGRMDFHPVERCPQISLDFDMKRRPLIDTIRVDIVDGYEVAGFETAPWDTVADYVRARDIARHIASQRPGTTGDDRPTGCLRTIEEWRTWQRRFDSSVGRRIRTAESALLTEIVAAQKEGLIDVPVLGSAAAVDQKLAWLSSLGLGDFTRAQWEHMSKKARRQSVLRDADLDTVRSFLAASDEW